MDISKWLSLLVSFVALLISSFTLLEKDQLSVRREDWSEPRLAMPARVEIRPVSRDDFDIIIPSLVGTEKITFANGGNRAIWVKEVSAIVAMSELTDPIWNICTRPAGNLSIT